MDILLVGFDSPPALSDLSTFLFSLIPVYSSDRLTPRQTWGSISPTRLSSVSWSFSLTPPPQALTQKAKKEKNRRGRKGRKDGRGRSNRRGKSGQENTRSGISRESR